MITTKLPELNAKVELYGSPSWIVNTIAKEDLKDYLNEQEIKNLTDDDMARIADRLGFALMNDYWGALDVILDEYKK